MTPRPSRGRLLLTGLPIAGLLLLGACTDEHADAGGDGPRPGGRPGAGPTAPSDDPANVCPVSGVRIRALGTNAAMGLRALGLELTNCGTADYALNGYPSLRLLDADGTPIPVQVIEGAKGITSGFDAPPRPLTLRPGERAGAAVLWRNLVTDSTVVATSGEALEVASSAGRARQAVELDGPIDLGNTGRLGVSAWKPAEPTTPAPPPAPPQPSGAPSGATTLDPRV
ncbi:DUF4232 domain-containing protein [Micromonospora musae]|uniref:DUF4232 domain-containing protein n=1 Tax=Micromonospora musae TaxID=1894970 RepID=UPI001F1E338E|nr:DUF4232 domain-containing protein [Micromonospora musae]